MVQNNAGEHRVKELMPKQQQVLSMDGLNWMMKIDFLSVISPFLTLASCHQTPEGNNDFYKSS